MSSLHFIWCFSLKISFLETNLQESADWYWLANKFLIQKETSYFMKCLLMTVLSPGHFTSDMGQAQGTNVTPLPLFNIRKEGCPGYKVGFMTK